MFIVGAMLFSPPQHDSQSKKLSKMQRIELAIEQELEKTKDLTTGEVPRERLLAARQYADRLRSQPPSNRAAISGIQWQERGPNNVSGRTRAILVDANDGWGNTLWAGGAGGGLWKTTNVLSPTPTWTAVDDLFDNLAISSIAQDPSNGQNMYFGTGEGWFNGGAIRGLGIWKSSNGGTTWSQLASTNNSTFHYVQKLVINSSGTIFAATRAGGLQRSTNGGTSWTKVLGNATGGGADDQAADVEIASNGDIYCSLGIFSTDGIYKSTDNGATWTKQAGGLPAAGFERIELATAPSNSDRVYALFQDNMSYDCSGIYRTDNGGTTWTSLPVPSAFGMPNFCRGQGWYDLIAAVDPNDDDRVFIGGIDLLVSDNAGANWSQISQWYGGGGFQEVHADQHAIVFEKGNSNRIYFGNDGGVFRTFTGSNFTPTISFISNGYNVTQFYAADLHPSSLTNEYIAGAQDNGTQRFTSSGMNNTTEVNGGDGAFCHIDQDQPNIQIASYVFNDYTITNDSWSSTTDVVISNSLGSFINPTDYDSDNNTLYGGYAAGEYSYITGVGTSNTSGSRSIAAFAGAEVTCVRVSPNVANRVYFGLNNGSVVRVDNAHSGAAAGTVVRTGMGSVSCVTLEIGTEAHMLVSYSNYGQVSVFESTNSGTSWTAIEGNIPDMPVRWIEFAPNNNDRALVATELGVWSTDNINGTTTNWGPTNGGLANTRVDMLAQRPSDKEMIAATHGRGLFSTDGFSDCPSPLNLTVSGISGSSATFNWTAATNATSYQIEYRIDGTTTWALATSNATGTSHTVNGLLGNVTYNWRIRSNCSGSNSSFKDGPDFTTGGPVCNPPTGLTVSGVTSNQATLNWAPVSGAVAYELRYKVAGGSIWTTVPNLNVTNYTLIGLTFGTTYNWEVRTECSQNYSAYVAGSDFTTLGAPCDGPSGLTVNSVGTNSANVSWGAVSGVAYYTLQYRIAGTTAWTTLTISNGTSSATINNLSQSTTYNWQVQTHCSFSSSLYVAGPNFTTTFITTGCNSIVSSFPHTNNFESGLGWSNVTGDNFDWTHNSGTTPSSGTGPNGAAEGKFYGYMEVSTPNNPSKTAILNGPCLNLTSVSNPEMTFQYHMLGIDVGILRLEVSTDGINWTQIWFESATQGSLWLPATVSLNAYTNETQLRIRYRGTSGSSWQGDMCLDDIFIGASEGKCSAPAELGTSNITANSATISWSAVLGASSYDVRYRVAGTSTWTTITGLTSNSTVLNGLLANTNYEWEVRTNCKDGASIYVGSQFMTLNPAACAGIVTSFPYTNSFESGIAWTNETGDDFDWTRRSGGTPSSGTGPIGAAHGTWYAYMEVSSPNNPSKTATLTSPCFNLTSVNDPEFIFQYHMLGGSSGNPGTLRLEASTNGSTWTQIWSELGNQGSAWNPTTVPLSSYTNATALRLRFRGTSGTHWQGDMCVDDLQLISGSGNNCPPLDFTINQPVSFGGTQDQGTVQVQDAGATVYLANNAWKAINMNYTVTANTVIEFDFRSTIQGEVQGIGFDNDNSISSNYTFRLYGTQNWGISNYDNYAPSAWKSYTIPVGAFYTGNFTKLVFACDHDVAPSNGNAWFRNVTIHEGNCGPTAFPTVTRNVIAEIGNEGEFNISAYPNPFNDLVYVDMAGMAGTVTVEIFDAMGKKVWQDTNVEAGSRVGLKPNISSGIYLLRVSQGDARRDIKLVKSN